MPLRSSCVRRGKLMESEPVLAGEGPTCTECLRVEEESGSVAEPSSSLVSGRQLEPDGGL
jgi:hypothetical protein